MNGIEQKIKDFAKEQGVELVGVAGPERLNGPPSLDPTYTMRGARSIVSMAMPMDVEAIYDFLGKKSPAPHSLDQTRMNQKMNRISSFLAGYIGSLGYRAAAVPANNSYRRSLDVFANHPSFSHRFGAIAAGIAAQGWSGNVMTKEYGASVYLGTVVTEAVLQSDPAIPPRYFIDNYCKRCKVCEKTCVAGMFDAQDEDYVLINDELHPRGKRLAIDLCNASCFGLHSLSRDKKWTTWGFRWIKDWIDNEPDPSKKLQLRNTLLTEGGKTGDSTPRFEIIRNIAYQLQPEDVIDEYLDSHPERHRESERFERFFVPFAKKLGVKQKFQDERILTCGQCASVCGPSVDESVRRYNLLLNSGLVVPGPNGEMVNAATYEEAVEIRRQHYPRVSAWKQIKDGLLSLFMWNRRYFGFEVKSIIQNFLYQRKMKKALRKKLPVIEQPALDTASIPSADLAQEPNQEVEGVSHVSEQEDRRISH